MAAWLLLVMPFFQGGVAVFHGYPEADALEYDISLTLHPEARRLEGKVLYTFRAMEDLEAVRLDSLAGKDWQVSFSTTDGRPLRAERDGDLLRVRLPKKVPAGEKVQFEASLQGVPPDGLYFFKTRYGKPCVFTDHFPIRARGWLPSEDAPEDRALFHLSLTFPQGFDAIGSGREAAGEATGSGGNPAAEGMQTRTFATEVPLPTYLLAFAVSPFAELKEEGDARLIPHRVYRKDLPRARRGLIHHAEWLHIMEKTFGPYSYSRYCIVQVPTRWGGMENAGNTFVMEPIFDRERFGIPVLAHEFAHQWFGDAVGYRNWDEIWLSEGFASYLGPWLDSQTGGPTLEASMDGLRTQWLRAPEGRTLPVRWRTFSKPVEVLNSNAYPKGAWVLHMLRQEVGDKAFFKGLRAYYQANRNQAVTSVKLQGAVERASGQPLGWFFRQWLDRPGCPELAFQWKPDGVGVSQEQEGKPYRFPLTIAWTDAAGKSREKTVRIEKPVTDVPLENGPIRTPRIDPHVALLYRPAR